MSRSGGTFPWSSVTFSACRFVRPPIFCCLATKVYRKWSVCILLMLFQAKWSCAAFARLRHRLLRSVSTIQHRIPQVGTGIDSCAQSWSRSSQSFAESAARTASIAPLKYPTFRTLCRFAGQRLLVALETGSDLRMGTTLYSPQSFPAMASNCQEGHHHIPEKWAR